MDIAKKLKLINIKKYKRCDRQVELELNYLYNWNLILIILIKYLHEIYNNEKMIENIKTRQDINSK